MTPEQGSKSGENFNLRPARAGYPSNICLSSPNAPVLYKLQGKGKWQLKADHCRHWPEGQGGRWGKKGYGRWFWTLHD